MNVLCWSKKWILLFVEHIKAELNIKADVNVIEVINEIIDIIFHFPLAVFICERVGIGLSRLGIVLCCFTFVLS